MSEQLNEQQEELQPVGDESTENASDKNVDETENSSVNDIENQLKEKDDKYLRLYAEFENYKRRTSAERIELIKSAGKEVILAMLPVLDDFERALKSMEQNTSAEQMKEGIELVHNKLKNILHSKGLKAMDCKGEVFNPDLHEAITNIPAPDESMKDKIIDELERGYFLGDKVIRYAKVVVGN
ncbi:MAG: nucleotide exchange factor GrpE [Bacteroidia bacterium]|jgi:molecular chaperone GrpE|nr:nucleotide exchange factor GrpE [Bacteroidia bacterium]